MPYRSDTSGGWPAAGYTVISLHTLGRGIPDLLVGAGSTNILLEIKSPGGTLTPAGRIFIKSWRGPVFVVNSATTALKYLSVFIN